MTDDLKAPERSMSMYLSVEDMLRDRIATLEAALAETEALEEQHGAVIQRLHTELADAQKERDTAREWLGAANNEFGSAAWDWPDLWRRIAQLKDLSNERWQRAEKAEAALADMTRQRDAAIKSLADVREETIRLNTATDAQYAKTVAKLREERDAAMAGAVKVRELVWKEEPRNGWKIGVSHAEGYHLIRRDDGWHYGNHDGGVFDTIEAAKAAAQRDYEARILSALTPDPDRLLALTAAAYGDAAAVIEDNVRHAKELGREIWAIPDLRTRIPSDALAALSRIEAQAEARGMRKAARLADEGYAAGSMGNPGHHILALAEATEAAAKGGV